MAFVDGKSAAPEMSHLFRCASPVQSCPFQLLCQVNVGQFLQFSRRSSNGFNFCCSTLHASHGLPAEV